VTLVLWYSGQDDFISRANSRDSPEVSKLKSRARLRHEAVNGKIKISAVLIVSGIATKAIIKMVSQSSRYVLRLLLCSHSVQDGEW
jgi:hypothetical protein